MEGFASWLAHASASDFVHWTLWIGVVWYARLTGFTIVQGD